MLSDPLRVKTRGTPTCQAFTAANSEHVAQGRAYEKLECIGFFCWFPFWPKTTVYYAAGSNDRLETNGSAEVTRYTLDGETFSTVDCRLKNVWLFPRPVIYYAGSIIAGFLDFRPKGF